MFAHLKPKQAGLKRPTSTSFLTPHQAQQLLPHLRPAKAQFAWPFFSDGVCSSSPSLARQDVTPLQPMQKPTNSRLLFFFFLSCLQPCNRTCSCIFLPCTNADVQRTTWHLQPFPLHAYTSACRAYSPCDCSYFTSCHPHHSSAQLPLAPCQLATA